MTPYVILCHLMSTSSLSELWGPDQQEKRISGHEPLAVLPEDQDNFGKTIAVDFLGEHLIILNTAFLVTQTTIAKTSLENTNLLSPSCLAFSFLIGSFFDSLIH